jgi:hypothetical protein
MTTAEIETFVQRLQRRELGSAELSALTTRDLDDINAYLAARLGALRNPSPKRTGPASRHHEYSEAEILAEFAD